jgi:hypothetical protein
MQGMVNFEDILDVKIKHVDKKLQKLQNKYESINTFKFK